MSKNVIVQNLINIAVSNGTEGALRDALNERAKGGNGASVLEQEWRHDCMRDGSVGTIYDPDGEAPDLREWYDEIAAMPDAYRALNVMRRCFGLGSNIMTVSKEDRELVIDALKKAGIE